MVAPGTSLPVLAVRPPGSVSESYIERLAATECPALTQRRARRQERSGAPQDPIVWASARGANVSDVDGNVFVDLSAGFGAASVGHSHPRVQQAIRDQSERLMHALGDLQPADVKIDLLQAIAALFDRPVRVMLGLSGSDAVEAALKTAVLHSKRPGVLAFKGAYHGLSHGPLAVCGYSDAFRAPFAAQLNPHVSFAPYPRTADDVRATLAAVSGELERGSIGAVLTEPMLGRGGVVVPPAGFLRDLHALCREHGALLIVDEVMTGFGRTGRMFGFEHDDIEPDLICLGKGLGGGMPVSACVGRADVMTAWAGDASEALYTGTFFGHPLAAAAALATLQVLRDEDLVTRARQLGARLIEQLQTLPARARVAAVRGRGLLVGIELDSGARALRCMQTLLESGYITVPAGEGARVISLTPPLCITSEQLDGFVSALTRTLVETS
jgi:4-aminobutyrate aminotransferase/(S)-3-amino-2-methylpropionate transaminase